LPPADEHHLAPLHLRLSFAARRQARAVSLRNPEGACDLQAYDSMLTHCSDPRDAAELLLLRENLRS
jgi:hypothetical protein